MDEQDYKYLISSYQQKAFDLMSQLIAMEARVKKLTDVVETLNVQVSNQEKEIEKLSQKPKRTSSEQ